MENGPSPRNESLPVAHRKEKGYSSPVGMEGIDEAWQPVSFSAMWFGNRFCGIPKRWATREELSLRTSVRDHGPDQSPSRRLRGKVDDFRIAGHRPQGRSLPPSQQALFHGRQTPAHLV